MELLHILIYFSSVPSERRSFHKSFRQVLMAKGEKLYLSLNGNRIPTCYLFVGRFSRLLLSQTRERVRRIHSRSSGVDLWMSVPFGSNFVKHRSIIDTAYSLMMLQTWPRIFRSKVPIYNVFKYYILYYFFLEYMTIK